MSPSQKKAVASHRKRQLEKGIVRLEINVPAEDRDLMRTMAARLREGGNAAADIRSALLNLLGPKQTLNFKELLEQAPLDGVELERLRESFGEGWREIEV